MNVTRLVYALIGLCGVCLSACSPINSSFSCNATAGDNCLTIEQVDAMTRYADGVTPYQSLKHQRAKSRESQRYSHLSQNTKDNAIWFAKKDSIEPRVLQGVR